MSATVVSKAHNGGVVGTSTDHRHRGAQTQPRGPCCALTAKMSIHTKRSTLAPAHAAATRSPHRPPQQCDRNTVAGPVKGLTKGRSAKRQRPWSSVAGFTRYFTT